jgi:hypothetical protein
MVAGDGARACRGGPEPLRRAPSACHPSDARPVRRRLLPGGRRSHPDALATTAVLTIRAAADAVVGPGQRRSRARTEAQQKECYRPVSFPPPTRPLRTCSPSVDRAAEAQEMRHFRRKAVDLGQAPQGRNPSLTAAFLRGCSLRPFGTRSSSSLLIKHLAECGPASSSKLHSGERDPASKQEPVRIRQAGVVLRSRVTGPSAARPLILIRAGGAPW